MTTCRRIPRIRSYRDVNEGWATTAPRRKCSPSPSSPWMVLRSPRPTCELIESKQRRDPPARSVPTSMSGSLSSSMTSAGGRQPGEEVPRVHMLMKEYRDGILLFKLTDQKVWSKAVKDTVGLTTTTRRTRPCTCTPRATSGCVRLRQHGCGQAGTFPGEEGQAWC